MSKKNDEEKTVKKREIEEEIEQNYLELKLLDSQMKQVQSQMQTIEEQIMQYTMSVQTISEIEKMNRDSEVLIQVTPGVFTKGKITDTKEFMISIGANACITKTPEETKKMLQSRINELKAYNQQLLIHLQKLNEAAMNREIQLKELVERANKSIDSTE